MQLNSRTSTYSANARVFVANQARDWTLLASPVAWYRCFELLFDIRWSSRKWRLGHHTLLLLTLGLVGVFCYLFWLISFNTGQYLKLLSSFASAANHASDSAIDAVFVKTQAQFNSDIRVTVLIVVFIAVVYALILTFEGILAAMWRRGIYDQLFVLQFSSDEDAAAAILWHTSRNGHASCLFDVQGQAVRIVDLPSRMSIELHQFTVNFGAALFGGLFFNGFLEAVIIVASFTQYIINQSGDATSGSSGIGLAYGVFFFCLLLLMFVNLFYNRWNRYALYYRAELRSVVQKLLEYAESVAMYGTFISMELPRVRSLLFPLQYYSALISLGYGGINFSIALLGSLSTVISYILPSVLFFYLRNSTDQTPSDANAYLAIVSFYSSLFNQLANFLLLGESLMITVNLGNRIHELRAQMKTIHCAWMEISARERATQRRRYEKEMYFQISHLKVLVPVQAQEDVKVDSHFDKVEDGSNSLASLISRSESTYFTVLQEDLCVPKLAYGESLLLYGSSGCGKTSIFRICAGLWPVDVKFANDMFNYTANGAKLWWTSSQRRTSHVDAARSSWSSSPSSSFVALPSSLLFVPQKPYHCIGSMRDQLLMLLSDDERRGITSDQLNSLLELTELRYLADRFGFERVCEWEHVLSLGEQQQIAFLRVLAAPHLLPTGSRLPFLLLLDESTSALDMASERRLYQALQAHGLWYVSISHRQSLRVWHHRIIRVDGATDDPGALTQEEMLQEMLVGTRHTAADDLLKRTQLNESSLQESEDNLCLWTWLYERFCMLVALLQVLHVPFENSSGMGLRAKTLVAWLLLLMCVVITVHYTYELAVATFSVFSVLANYASQNITLNEAKDVINSQIGSVIALDLGTLIASSAVLALGQYIASLYTLRQSQHLATSMLAENRIYHMQQQQQLTASTTARRTFDGGHSRSVSTSQLPALLSQDIPALNSNLFYFLCGSIYYTGALPVLGLLIVLGQLLSKQVGGESMLEIMFINAFIMSVVITMSLLPYVHYESRFQKSFDEFAWRHQRLDEQAEQIALSPGAIRHNEAFQLHRSLMNSCVAQMHSALWYGLFCFSSYLCHRIDKVMALVVSAIIFFELTDSSGRTAANANNLVAVSAYVSMIQTYFNFVVLGIWYPFGQVCIIGQRVLDTQSVLLQHGHKRHGTSSTTPNNKQESQQSRAGNYTDEVTIDVQHLNIYDVFPGGTILLSNLSFTLFRHDNLLIRGPSGCGKSQLLRILAGLLPIPDTASILRAEPTKHVFLSQRLYLIRGTLREQVNYFNRARQLPDITDIKDALNRVHLAHLVHRFELDALVDWEGVASSGEQQRLILGAALACPQIDCIFLDETTAACDLEVELDIFTILQQSGKQFITVSHRPEVAEYHTCILTLDPLSKSFTWSDRKLQMQQA